MEKTYLFTIIVMRILGPIYLLTFLPAMLGVSYADTREPIPLLSFDEPRGSAADRNVIRPNFQMSVNLPENWAVTTPVNTNLKTSYQLIDEAGEKYLRVEVDNNETGAARITCPIPNLNSEIVYQVSFIARSKVPMPIVISLHHQLDNGLIWRKKSVLSGEWTQYEHTFMLDSPGHELNLSIQFLGSSTYDLIKVHLRAIDTRKTLEVNNILETERNFLPVSRFPLGLQPGMFLNENDSLDYVVSIDTDTSILGPSGSHPLRVRTLSEGPVRLTFPPFSLPDRRMDCMASVYLKGKANLICKVFGGDRELIAEKNVTLQVEDGWQRILMPFKGIPFSQGYCLQIHAIGKGVYLADALQVSEGKKPKDYIGQMPFEIALKLPESEASMAGIQFSDEPPTLEYCTTGQYRNAFLHIEIEDIYGHKTVLKKIRLDDPFHNYGRIEYLEKEISALGPFRINACVMSEDGQRLSPDCELIAYRLRRPRHWLKDAPGSYFGVHVPPTKQGILMAKAIGLNWVRLHDTGAHLCGWWWLEKEPGKWRFRDELLMRYRSHHLSILGVIATTPPWASYMIKPHSKYFDRYYLPRNLTDFENYVAKVTSQYQENISTYEVWNEPWIHAYIPVELKNKEDGSKRYETSETPFRDYALLVKSAYDTVKENDLSISIAGLNTSTFPERQNRSFDGGDWTRGTVEEGILNHMDIATYHQYLTAPLGSPGDSVEEGFRRALPPTLNIEDTFPIWLTEGSAIFNFTGFGFYKNTLTFDNNEDVWLTSGMHIRFTTRLLAQGVEKIFYYSMGMRPYLASESRKSLFHYFTAPDLSLHPSGAAHSNLAWFLDGEKFFETIPLGFGLQAYIFGGESNSVAILMTAYGANENVEYIAPDELVLFDIFGNEIQQRQKWPAGIIIVHQKLPPSKLKEILLNPQLEPLQITL